MKKKQTSSEQPPRHDEQLTFDGAKREAERKAERLQAVQYLHWRAFVAQWKADGKREDDHAGMKAAFDDQQKQMLARKITVSIRFANNQQAPITTIAKGNSDPTLQAIYVAGLSIHKL